MEILQIMQKNVLSIKNANKYNNQGASNLTRIDPSNTKSSIQPDYSKAKMFSVAVLSCFNQYLNHDRDAINKFIYSDQCVINDSDTKIIESYWKNILSSENLQRKTYEQTIQLIQIIIDRKIELIIKNMTEWNKQQYETITHFNKQVMRSYDLQMKLAQKELIYAEILSLFFKINLEVARKHKSCFENYTIQMKTICKILHYQPTYVKSYFQRYCSFQQYISYDFQEQFGTIVKFILLLELKKKKSLNMRNINQRQKSQLVNQQTDISQQLQMFNSKKQHHYLYKFCQVMHLNSGGLIEDISPSRRYEIIDKLRKIVKIKDYQEQKIGFLTLKSQNCVSFDSLQYILNGILKTNLQAVKQFEYDLNIKALILQCQWIFINNNQFYQDFQKLVDWHFTDSRSLNKQSYTTNLLAKLAHQRLLLFSSVMRSNILLLTPMKLLRNIYLIRFQYSYNEIKGIKETINQQKDMKSTLILGSDETNIVFYVVNKLSTQNIKQVDRLKNSFEKMAKKYRQRRYAIYFYEKEVSKFISYSEYLKLIQFFKHGFNSLIFITNLVQKFFIHFLIHAQVQICLKHISDKLTKDNFFIYCKQIITPIIFMMKEKLNNDKRLRQVRDNS